MISHLNRISEQSIERGLLRMNNRVVVAAVLGVCMFYINFYFAPNDLLHNSEFFFYWSGSILSVAICLSITKWGPSLLKRRNGGRILRSLFMSAALIYALSCAFGIRILMLRLPLGVYNISATTTLIWGCTVVVSTCAFDLLACSLFVLSIMMPIVWTCAFQVPAQNLAAMCAFSMLFFLYLGRAIHIAEIEAIVNEETIRKQGRALEASNKLFQETIDSIDEIFLLLDLNGACIENPSSGRSGVLGRDPLGLHFSEILRLPHAKIENSRDWFKVLCMDQLEFAELAQQGPDTLQVEDRSFHARYFAKRGPGGALDGVILTLTDVTEQLRNEVEVQGSKERAEFVLSASANSEGLRRFVSDAEKVFRGLDLFQGRSQDELRIILHTLKGTAAIFHIPALVRAIDNTEKFVKASEGGDFTFMPRERNDLLQALADWRESEKETLARLRIFDSSDTRFNEEHALRMSEIFAQDEKTAELLRRFTRSLRAENLDDKMRAFERHVERLSLKLHKTIRFEYHPLATSEVFIAGEAYAQVLRSCVHLFNNGADHGIEGGEARRAAGKDPAGTLKLSIEKTAKTLRMIFEDDGAGIDPKALRAALQTKGRKIDAMSDAEVLRSIFDTGFSTRQETTEISGHGVGLGALFADVRAAGGTLEVDSKLERGTRFTLELPLHADQVFFLPRPQSASQLSA